MKQFILFLTTGLLLTAVAGPTGVPKLTKKLLTYCASLTEEFSDIPNERRADLDELGQYLYEKTKAAEDIKVTVICTHNSRRSQMGQLWLMVAAEWYGLENLEAFSGGTEATAFNKRAVAALSRAGFRMDGGNANSNPTYSAAWHRGSRPASRRLMFSKKYTDNTNPTADFAALMVCSDADESCPVVPGAEFRLSTPFDDPRYFDDTPSEEAEYDKTCRLIARDMFYAVNHAKSLLMLDAERTK